MVYTKIFQRLRALHLARLIATSILFINIALFFSILTTNLPDKVIYIMYIYV